MTFDLSTEAGRSGYAGWLLTRGPVGPVGRELVWEDLGLDGLTVRVENGTQHLSPASFQWLRDHLAERGVNLGDRDVRKSDLN